MLEIYHWKFFCGQLLLSLFVLNGQWNNDKSCISITTNIMTLSSRSFVDIIYYLLQFEQNKYVWAVTCLPNKHLFSLKS